MNTKRWTISFVTCIVVVLLGIMALNYFVDPYGYFRAQDGDCYDLDENDYLRELKAEHIKNFSDEYDAYLIGGSKAGALRTDKLTELDGHTYYNCWVLSGNFPDYLAYTKYIVENTKAKKILLQISTSELYDFDRQDLGTIYEVPAELTGDSKIAEYASFLMKNPKVSWDELTNNDPKYPCMKTGERDLKKYYDFFNANRENKIFYWSMLNQSKVYYKYLEKGGKEKPRTVENCMAMLREIKALCVEHNVELQVFFGALFAGQMVQYEGESFYSFMKQVVALFGDVWCFNTYNPVTRCTYNFYNPSHYFYEVGDLMIDRMAGKKTQYEDFGIRLTQKNVDDEIARRREILKIWKEFYNKNGVLPYAPFDSKYCLKKIYG